MGWNYFWAGGAGDQSRYNQFPFAGCAVGCGPTAGASCSAGVTARPRAATPTGPAVTVSTG